MKKIKLKLVFIVVVVLFSVGCAHVSDKFLIEPEPWTFEQYRGKPKSVRVQYEIDYEKEVGVAHEYKEFIYRQGKPVYWGDGTTGYTAQWDKRNSLVHYYPGHIQGQMSIELLIADKYVADKFGNIKYETIDGIRRPMKIDHNFTNNEATGRFYARKATDVLAAGLNGALSAGIGMAFGCNDCGGPAFFNSNNAQSDSATNADIKFDMDAFLE